MREILFRGQRIDNGEWVEGDLIQIGGGALIYHGDKQELEVIKNEDSPCSVGFYQNEISVVIPKTVGQFTGLNDKNGVKIFEGDIIQDKYDESCNHVIKYFEEESCFGVLYIGLNGSLTPMSRLAKDWINEFDEVVIGNIHKNPELLTESNFKPF
jgi:uncharacterized phage protein (TIGR01671 family)